MPRKLRRPKRRMGEEAEARAWSMLLRTGYDYLGDLRVFGIGTDDEARALAPKAWRRFGRALMDAYDSDPSKRIPWAFEQFGEP